MEHRRWFPHRFDRSRDLVCNRIVNHVSNTGNQPEDTMRSVLGLVPVITSTERCRARQLPSLGSIQILPSSSNTRITTTMTPRMPEGPYPHPLLWPRLGSAPIRRRTNIMSSMVPMDIRISVSASRSNNLPELQRFQAPQLAVPWLVREADVLLAIKRIHLP